MSRTLPNANDPRGGTPMNTGDELRQIIDNYVDAMINSVRTGYVVHPTENVISPYHGKFHLKKEIAALLHKSNLQRGIDELKTSLHEYERTDFETGGSDSHQHYLRDRIAELQAELQQVESEDV